VRGFVLSFTLLITLPHSALLADFSRGNIGIESQEKEEKTTGETIRDETKME